MVEIVSNAIFQSPIGATLLLFHVKMSPRWGSKGRMGYLSNKNVAPMGLFKP